MFKREVQALNNTSYSAVPACLVPAFATLLGSQVHVEEQAVVTGQFFF